MRKRNAPSAGLEAPRAIAAVALAVFGTVAAAVTLIAVVESYSNLLAFALDHGLSNWRAAFAPAAVDSFVIMGELLLFAALLLQWAAWSPYILGTAMAVWGFALSVGGNIWHAPVATFADRAVSAIWPVTATAGLAGGLIIAKRLIADRKAPSSSAASPAKSPDPRTGTPPPRRASRDPGLAAARNDIERELAVELTLPGAQPWPSARQLALDPRLTGGDSTRRRAAARILQLAGASQNGGSHDS